MKHYRWIKVYKFFDKLQADELEQILVNNNIPVRVVIRQDSVFPGVFKPSIGEGIIEVRQAYVEQAQCIIDEYLNQK